MRPRPQFDIIGLESGDRYWLDSVFIYRSTVYERIVSDPPPVTLMASCSVVGDEGVKRRDIRVEKLKPVSSSGKRHLRALCAAARLAAAAL